MLTFSGTILALIWRFLSCDFILVPVPGPLGDAYAAKWICPDDRR